MTLPQLDGEVTSACNLVVLKLVSFEHTVTFLIIFVITSVSSVTLSSSEEKHRQVYEEVALSSVHLCS